VGASILKDWGNSKKDWELILFLEIANFKPFLLVSTTLLNVRSKTQGLLIIGIEK
jgi:hypothetical protein